MTTQAEYTEQYIVPVLEKLTQIISVIKETRSNIPMSFLHPNTPELERIIQDGEYFYKITQFYDLKINSNDPTTVTEVILQFIDTHQSKLLLKKPLPPLVNFKNFILSIEHGTTVISQRKLGENDKLHEKILEGSVPYSRFSSYFSACKKAISEVKIEDTTIEDIDFAEEVPETFEGLTSNELETLIKNENLTSNFISNVSEKILLQYRGALFKAINHIKNSPFKKVLANSEIIIGTRSALNSQGYSYSGSKAIALYWHRKDKISYPITKEGESIAGEEIASAYITLIHELGHRYHYRMMPRGYFNPYIMDLYEEAKRPKEQCYLDQLPKIGDSLSNLREDWWSVKKASDDYLLTSIFRNTYTYTNSKGDVKEIQKKDILKRITCPSQYGSKDHTEFFAEMFTLITLGLVKPSQKPVADKFMEIVNRESI